MVIAKQLPQIISQGGGICNGVLKLAGIGLRQVIVKYSEISYLIGNQQMLQIGIFFFYKAG